MADNSVHCCVTSPPYWGLRSYLNDDDPLKPQELGLEPTLQEFVAAMVAVFREVRRVLRPDGVCWINLGDSYATAPNGRSAVATKAAGNDDRTFRDKPFSTAVGGLKPKDLCGIPWRVAFALQDDGWYLRSDIIWAKPNPMPESVEDRPTKAHEYLFLMTKRERYFYDAEATREEPAGYNRKGGTATYTANGFTTNGIGSNSLHQMNPAGRNRRTVWSIATEAYPGAHFATFPTKLVEPCILAGTSARGCCPKCGAGWRRVVEQAGYTPETVPIGDRNVDNSRGDKTRKLNGKSKEWKEHAASIITTGWQPSCSCGLSETVPAIVFDPFCGSGTTGQVARELGRRFIGLDLNPSYLVFNALPRSERKTSSSALAELPLFSMDI